MKFGILVPLAALVFAPLAVSPASAETTIIKKYGDHDRGLHRGWDHGRGHAWGRHRFEGGSRKVVIKKRYGDGPYSTGTVKKVIKFRD